MEKQVIIAVSGYFDPLHEGHLEYLGLAKELGDKLIVILNNTEQAILKKGRENIGLSERKAVLEGIDCVDEVVISIDKGKSVCESLRMIMPDIFAKGGDRFAHEIPEADICKQLNIRIIDRLGKKINSSSDIVKNQ